MKVLQVVGDGTPGGGTTNVLALTEDLLGAGIDVLFCSQVDSYAQQAAANLGAKVVGQVNFFAGRLDRRAPRCLADLVRRVDPDIVHLHGGRAAFFFSSHPPTGRWRSVYTVRGYHFLNKPWPLRQLAAMAERRSSRVIHQTVFVCQYDQDLAARFRLLPSGQPGVVIRNGIRLDDIPQQTTPRDPRSVAVLGRLTIQKDPHLVLDLAQRLAGDGFTFHLIGGGDMEQEIRQRVQRQSLTSVHLYGSLARPQALEAMQQCGTFLLASRWEGLPIAPVEAMQMGLVVVVSAVSGNTEVVVDGQTGYVVEQADRNAYVSALRRLAGDAALRSRFIDAGRSRVKTHFTRQRVVTQYQTLYQELRQQP